MKTSPSLRPAGFTLVELLVSITILSLMLFTLAQVIAFVSQLWINGVGAVDNFSKARDIMSVMDRDIQQMVMRPDLKAFVDNSNSTPPNPACAFYTNVQGSPGTDTRSVSLVEYVPNNGGVQGTLSRLNYGMNFTTPIVPSVGATNLPDLSKIPTSGTTETIATGIIGFGYQFVDGTGTIQTPVPTMLSTAAPTVATPYTYFYDYTAPNAAANPRAVIVSVLVLNNAAYQLATANATIMTKLQTDFSGALPANETFAQYWNGTLNPATGTLDPTLPPSVRAGLRVFQRYIPLPLVTPAS
jgi:prepilin-type N-terminal cleavage/methylation domain-containing protein